MIVLTAKAVSEPLSIQARVSDHRREDRRVNDEDARGQRFLPSKCVTTAATTTTRTTTSTKIPGPTITRSSLRHVVGLPRPSHAR